MDKGIMEKMNKRRDIMVCLVSTSIPLCILHGVGIGNAGLGVFILFCAILGIWAMMSYTEETQKKNSETNNSVNTIAFKEFQVVKTKTVGDYTFLVSQDYNKMGIKYNLNVKVVDPVIRELENLTKVEILQNDVIIKESGVGRALVGGIIAGGAGAVVGANTAKQTTEVDEIVIKFTFSDVNNPIHKVRVYQKNIDQLRLYWETVLNEADELVGMFDAIRDELKKSQQEETLQPKVLEETTDFEEKLLKLAKLRDKNIITQEEFEQKKKEIIDRL